MPFFAKTIRGNGAAPEYSAELRNFKEWFEQHITLDGEPYTLDYDQARAVLDQHKNTLITARAGSGKTRVIVAKIAYLVTTQQAHLYEIAAFMFNRTAATEVNERIAGVKFDGVPLPEVDRQNLQRQNSTSKGKTDRVSVASTFHKFALDIVKLSGEKPEIISETEHDAIIKDSLHKAIKITRQRISPREFDETLKIVSGFIGRAGQKFTGSTGLDELTAAVQEYCREHADDPGYTCNIRLHHLALASFSAYLEALRPPKIDFNLLMSHATELLLVQKPDQRSNSTGMGSISFQMKSVDNSQILKRVAPLKFILVDEYQDFSYLFLSIINAIRELCPEAHLFAVGDDWQAINRFAGSDVDYFINFDKFFPEDVVNIPLVTNYRSSRKVVENANDYMLKNYDPSAARAIPSSKKSGKVIRLNPAKTRFDAGDIHEDALGDARYQNALARHSSLTPKPLPAHIKPEAAQLLKSIYKILKTHHRNSIMLLHRHNFTSHLGITLDSLLAALREITLEQGIMTDADFATRVRCMTMHKSKGLESEVVILLELNRDIVLSSHPHASLWTIFGDSTDAEKADQERLLYVAMTRAKQKLYILSSDRKSPI